MVKHFSLVMGECAVMAGFPARGFRFRPGWPGFSPAVHAGGRAHRAAFLRGSLPAVRIRLDDGG